MMKFSRLIPLLVLLLPATAMAAKQSLHRNPDNGLYTWTSDGDGFSVELIQVVPDFIRAIYSKHNFPQHEIDEIASWCVYGSVIKNTSEKVLTYDVHDWYTIHDGKRAPVKTKTQWLEQWRKAGVVFSWTLLPDQGEFYQGDWQQGFTTVKLPRGSTFDLVYIWTIDGERRQNTIKGLICPPEEVEIEQ